MLLVRQSLFALTTGIYAHSHTHHFPFMEGTHCIRFLNQVKNSHLWRDFDHLENEIFRWPVLNLKALACQPLSTWNGHHVIRDGISPTKHHWRQALATPSEQLHTTDPKPQPCFSRQPSRKAHYINYYFLDKSIMWKPSWLQGKSINPKSSGMKLKTSASWDLYSQPSDRNTGIC